MSPLGSRTSVRALGWAKVAWGAALLAAPQALARAAHGGPPPPPAVRVARLLGAREAVQGTLTVLAGTQAAARRGAAVDGAHAVSMVGLAALDARHRRLALVSAALAVVEALAGRRLAARRG